MAYFTPLSNYYPSTYRTSHVFACLQRRKSKDANDVRGRTSKTKNSARSTLGRSIARRNTSADCKVWNDTKNALRATKLNRIFVAFYLIQLSFMDSALRFALDFLSTHCKKLISQEVSPMFLLSVLECAIKLLFHPHKFKSPKFAIVKNSL